jgi:hypothetical protein
MSRMEVLVVFGLSGLVALVYRNMKVRQMQMDLIRLENLEQNLDQIDPPATASERRALTEELETQQRALKLWWPRRPQRIQWEDLPMDKRFSAYF